MKGGRLTCWRISGTWAIEYPAVDHDFIRNGEFDVRKTRSVPIEEYRRLLEKVFAVEGRRSLQIEPHVPLTEENVRDFTYEHCPVCRDYYKAQIRPYVPQGMQVERRKVPKDEDLFASVETQDHFISDRFIEATRKLELTGIAFEDCVAYV